MVDSRGSRGIPAGPWTGDHDELTVRIGAPAVGPTATSRRIPQRWRAFSVCLVVGFMSLLDVSIVNVALPSIQKSLNASSSELQWVVSGYALTFGLVLVAAGRLGDVRGRRTMFLIGLVVFVVASAACGFATGPPLPRRRPAACRAWAAAS